MSTDDILGVRLVHSTVEASNDCGGKGLTYNTI